MATNNSQHLTLIPTPTLTSASDIVVTADSAPEVQVVDNATGAAQVANSTAESILAAAPRVFGLARRSSGIAVAVFQPEKREALLAAVLASEHTAGEQQEMDEKEAATKANKAADMWPADVATIVQALAECDTLLRKRTPGSLSDENVWDINEQLENCREALRRYASLTADCSDTGGQKDRPRA